MDTRDSRRAALVTGANRGIGLEVCRQLASRGLRVILTARDPKEGDAAARALRDEGLDVVAEPVDVTDAAAIRSLARQVDADVLVNNAAVLIGENATMIGTRIDDLRKTFETNVFGAVAFAQAFVPRMVERGYGRVVNVSSGAGQLSTMTNYAPAYSMSKAALNAFTRLLAAETSGSGVLVNCVDPGWVRTRMGGPTAPRGVEQGADTIVWLATLPANGPTGGFFRDQRQIEW
jgi:NAD(P)-dependent dehydrogenase (short-subunit alcohol dehydrogenase family)